MDTLILTSLLVLMGISTFTSKEFVIFCRVSQIGNDLGFHQFHLTQNFIWPTTSWFKRQEFESFHQQTSQLSQAMELIQGKVYLRDSEGGVRHVFFIGTWYGFIWSSFWDHKWLKYPIYIPLDQKKRNPWDIYWGIKSIAIRGNRDPLVSHG